MNLYDSWQQHLDALIQQQLPRMISLRRRMHTYPEPSGQEHETSFHLYQLLGDAGFDVRLGTEGRGVVADSRDRGASGQGLFALRADIDALHVQDQTQVEYRSQRPGVMHACGHDAHTACVTGALLAVRQLQLEGALPWPVSIRGILQPAEETSEGALEMIRGGGLEGVEAIAAAHVDPSRAVGRVGLRSGVLTANCDEMQIRILGRGGHAARPHESIDPITAAAQLINALYLHIPRVTDSQEAVVVTIGRIEGGQLANVIPEQVQLQGTLRTLDRRVRQQTIDHIRRLAAGVAQTSETRIEVGFGTSAPSVTNDAQVVHLLREAAARVVGGTQVDELGRPSMGSEDFAFYLEHLPGAMFRLGCASDQAGNWGLHSPMFDVDEAAIPIGARILARTAVGWFDPRRPQSPARGPTAAAVGRPS